MNTIAVVRRPIAAALGSLWIVCTLHGATVVGPAQHRSATATGDSMAPLLSGDGQCVVFVSNAPDLVTNIPSTTFSSGHLQLFLHDLRSGVTEFVSAGIGGFPGNGASDQPAVSEDGRLVAFISRATNLVAGDTNGVADLFLWDRGTRTVRLLSQSADAVIADAESAFPVMTPSGRYVGYETRAGNLVSGDTNRFWDVMVYDVEHQRNYRLSAPSRAPSLINRPSGDSRQLTVSDDGQVFAFVSSALNIAPGIVSGTLAHTNGLYVRPGLEGTNRMVNVFSPGLTALITVTPLACHLSGDGRLIVCLSSSSHPSLFPSGFHWANWAAGDSQLLPANLPQVLVTRFTDEMGPFITSDGSTVFYEGQASTGSWDPNQTVVLAWTASTKSAEVVSTLMTPTVPPEQQSGPGQLLAASKDGSFVAFLAVSSSTADETGSHQQVFVLHRPTRSLRQVTRACINGSTVGAHSWSIANFSRDGRRFVFQSTVSNLVEADRNSASDVFVYDWDSDRLELVSGRANPTAVMSTGPCGASMHPGGMSRDGNRVAFTSVQAGLAASDTNGVSDVFVQDLNQGTVTLVSAAFGRNAEGNGMSHEAVISADGRWVAFSSLASDLVDGDTNGLEDVFLRDLVDGRTLLVSRDLGSAPPLGDGARHIAIAPNGDHVAFTGRLTGATSISTDIFLYDRDQDNVVLITRALSGSTGGNSESGNPNFSPDGHWLCFESRANNLGVTGVFNAFSAYRVALGGGVIELMSPKTGPAGRALTLPAAATGFSPEGETMVFGRWSLAQRDLLLHEFASGTTSLAISNAAQGALSRDGTRLAYVTAPATGGPQVRLLDRVTGTDRWVSIGQQGEAGDSDSTVALVTPEGRHVIFASRAGNLVTGDHNRRGDIFLRDLVHQTTVMVSVTPEGNPGAGGSGKPVLSADGTTLAFTSYASDLLNADGNRHADIYVVRLPTAESGFRITTVTRLGSGEILLVWAVEPHRVYRVQTKADLAQPWSDLPLAIQLNGTQASALDTPPTGLSRRFYRLVEVL